MKRCSYAANEYPKVPEKEKCAVKKMRLHSFGTEEFERNKVQKFGESLR